VDLARLCPRNKNNKREPNQISVIGKIFSAVSSCAFWVFRYTLPDILVPIYQHLYNFRWNSMKHIIWIFLAAAPVLTIAEPVVNSQKLMDDWLNLEIQKGQLQSSWNLREQDLEQRFNLMEIELRRLNEVAAQRVDAASDVDLRRSELLQKQEVLEQEQLLTTDQLKKTYIRIRSLMPRLPPPLQSEWQTQIDLAAEEAASNSERLERMLTLLKMTEEFNSRIALHRGELSLNPASKDAQIIQVNQIYLGVSQGWYVSDDGKLYGYGRATPQGWQWWHGEDASAALGKPLHAAQISEVYGMLQNPTTADFVALPVKINQQ
jgi:hypothetical protein